MAWVTPRTWVPEELVTANLLNTHLRDNLNALKNPPSARYEPNEGSDYTTTSTSFVDVDATNLALTITTAGGDVMVGFHGLVAPDNVGAARVLFDVAVDGTRTAGNDGITGTTQEGSEGGARPKNVSFVRLISGLAAGSHTFKLQWRTNTGTATLYAGAGTSNADVHPQFWAREVS
jgi:hypothetical protein